MTFAKISAMIFFTFKDETTYPFLFCDYPTFHIFHGFNLAFNEFETRVREIFVETKYYDYTQYAC